MSGPAVILYLGPAEAVPWLESELGGAYAVRRVEPTVEAVEAAMPSAVVVLDASMKVPLTAERLAGASGLRLVITATTGVDHIDKAHLDQRSVPLLTLKTEREVLAKVNAAAELSWALLMGCARKLRSASAHVTGGGWDRTLFPGPMLRGKQLGIVGLGRNGRWCARYGAAFDMHVSAHDPFLSDWPAEIARLSLPDLVEKSDFLLVHVTYSPETHGLLGLDLAARCKPGSIWVNTSRGAIWDEEGLVRQLESGRLAAVGADVLAPEPEIQRSPLWQYAKDHDNVLLTPHIGGFSPDALETVLRHTAQRIVRHCA